MIEAQRLEDERGFFARVFCQQECAQHGLSTTITQCNISFNPRKGTLRGLHYQVAPFEEAKLIRCTQGAIHDVIVDLRPESTTYTKWTGIELSAENRKMLYVPANFAHGFITMEDSTEVFYQMSQLYSGEHGRGVRWNDPSFNIQWPMEPRIMNERDRTYPNFRAAEPQA